MLSLRPAVTCIRARVCVRPPNPASALYPNHGAACINLFLLHNVLEWSPLVQ